MKDQPLPLNSAVDLFQVSSSSLSLSFKFIKRNKEKYKI